MHYQGSRYRQDDREIYSAQAKASRAQLKQVEEKISALELERLRDPYSYGSPEQLALPSLVRLRNALRQQLDMQESGLKAAGGGQAKDEWRPASGSYFHGDHG
jgi:hypothetical protein